jgi:hypothetical protein
MSLKKKLGMAIVTTALGASIVAAGSFALFTSSATNAGITFTAGTVKITDQGATFATPALETIAGNMAPGDSVTKTITVKNEGTLDAWIKADKATAVPADSDATTKDELFTTGGATITPSTNVVKVAAGATTTFDVTVALPLTAVNAFQGQTGTFSVEFKAVQVRNNENAAGTAPISWNEDATV